MRKSKLEGQLETMYRISQRETNEEVQTKISYQIKKLQRRYFSQHNHFYNPTFRKREDYSRDAHNRKDGNKFVVRASLFVTHPGTLINEN